MQLRLVCLDFRLLPFSAHQADGLCQWHQGCQPRQWASRHSTWPLPMDLRHQVHPQPKPGLAGAHLQVSNSWAPKGRRCCAWGTCVFLAHSSNCNKRRAFSSSWNRPCLAPPVHHGVGQPARQCLPHGSMRRTPLTCSHALCLGSPLPGSQ